MEALFMTGPRDIIRQASTQRDMSLQTADRRLPAPVPMAAATVEHNPKAKSQVSQWRTPPLMQMSAEPVQEIRHTPEMTQQAENHEARRAVAQNIGGHAIYRELMRSHDRMGTRHIGKGG